MRKNLTEEHKYYNYTFTDTHTMHTRVFFSDSHQMNHESVVVNIVAIGQCTHAHTFDLYKHINQNDCQFFRVEKKNKNHIHFIFINLAIMILTQGVIILISSHFNYRTNFRFFRIELIFNWISKNFIDLVKTNMITQQWIIRKNKKIWMCALVITLVAQYRRMQRPIAHARYIGSKAKMNCCRNECTLKIHSSNFNGKKIHWFLCAYPSSWLPLPVFFMKNNLFGLSCAFGIS